MAHALRLFLVCILLLVSGILANPITNICYDCPPISKHGAENTFQEIHHGGLICFYAGMSSACTYDITSGTGRREQPSDCYASAQPVSCAPHHETVRPAQQRPPVKGGSILGLMKGKMGNRLNEQQREEKARILAELLAGGQYGVR